MTTNLCKKLLAFSAAALLVAASVSSSEARQHARQPSPFSEADTYRADYSGFGRDSSCFSRSTGLSDLYACGSHGG